MIVTSTSSWQTITMVMSPDSWRPCVGAGESDSRMSGALSWALAIGVIDVCTAAGRPAMVCVVAREPSMPSIGIDCSTIPKCIATTLNAARAKTSVEIGRRWNIGSP